MTQKKQKAIRKTDKKFIVNIPEPGYNKGETGNELAKPSKDFKELDFINNFLFSKVMLDPELCRKLLEIILDVEIERIIRCTKGTVKNIKRLRKVWLFSWQNQRWQS